MILVRPILHLICPNTPLEPMVNPSPCMAVQKLNYRKKYWYIMGM